MLIVMTIIMGIIALFGLIEMIKPIINFIKERDFFRKTNNPYRRICIICGQVQYNLENSRWESIRPVKNEMCECNQWNEFHSSVFGNTDKTNMETHFFNQEEK